MTSTGANTLATYQKRKKYLMAAIDVALRNNLVAAKVCQVDSSDSYTIQNPYSTAPTVAISALTGTYAVADYTITDGTLTVSDEFKAAEHVYDFEEVISDLPIMSNRLDDQAYSVAAGLDKWVINNLCEDGTGTYTTPTGGFTTAANINKIFGDLIGKVQGYSNVRNGYFIILENTDVSGLIQAGATNGFSFADSVLNNGMVGSYMGVDIYIVPSGTFVDDTLGTKTVTNSGHRVFGVKGVATFANPRRVQYSEKEVSGKTGKEVVTYGYAGFKLWANKASLVVDITLA